MESVKWAKELYIEDKLKIQNVLDNLSQIEPDYRGGLSSICKTREQKELLLAKFEKTIKKVLVDILNAGWYPVDFRLRCIYPRGNKGDFKIFL